MTSLTRSGTASQVLEKLAAYKLREVGRGKYRSNSPLRPGSDSEAFVVTIEDDEHGVYYDHVTGERGSLYELAKRLGIAQPARKTEQTARTTTKRAYSGLGEYAAAHHTPAEVFRRAKWSEVQKDGRPALAFPTKTGVRYRFLDGEKPVYKSPSGYRPCWYGLKAAAAMDGPLVICNGEASTIVGQYHGIAACCVTGGEKGAIAPDLLAELKSVAVGREVFVAFDSDETGRQASVALAAFLCAGGVQARAVDLALFKGGDLADFCGENGKLTLAALLRLAAPISPQPTKTKGRKLYSLTELNNMPPVRMLTPYIPERGLVVVYGPSGAGKSFWALDQALRLSQTTPTLYIAAEGQHGLAERGSAWERHHGQSAGNLMFSLERVSLDRKDDVQAFIAEIATFKPRVVFIDTLARCMSEGDENSARDMNRVIAGCEMIQRAIEGVVVIIHHTRKGSLVERGSSVLRAAADAMICVAKDDDVVEVTVDKVKDGIQPPPSLLRLLPVPLADDKSVPVLIAASKVKDNLDDPLTPHQRAVLGYLALADDALTAKEIEGAVNVPGKGVYRVMRALLWRKLVERVGARYRATTEGRDAAAKMEVAARAAAVSVQREGEVNVRKNGDTTDTSPISTKDSLTDTLSGVPVLAGTPDETPLAPSGEELVDLAAALAALENDTTDTTDTSPISTKDSLTDTAPVITDTTGTTDTGGAVMTISRFKELSARAITALRTAAALAELTGDYVTARIGKDEFACVWDECPRDEREEFMNLVARVPHWRVWAGRLWRAEHARVVG